MCETESLENTGHVRRGESNPNNGSCKPSVQNYGSAYTRVQPQPSTEIPSDTIMKKLGWELLYKRRELVSDSIDGRVPALTCRTFQ